MTDLHWFPFYVERFMGSRKVQRMTAEMAGGYMFLMIDEWRNGPIPKEEAAFISRLDDATALRLLSDCFTETSEGWINEALEEVRAEQEAKADMLSRAGKIGAKARWAQQRKGKRKATAKRPLSEANAIRGEEIRLEEKREEEITTEEKMPAAAPQPFAIVVEDESMGNGVTWTSTTVGDWNGGNVMDAYVQYCRRKGWPDPPTGQRAKLGAAGKRLASKSAPVEIIAAMVGMEQLFPYSKGEPWDLMDLEHKFTKAVAASENNPEIQRRRFERAFLGGEAT